MPCLRLLVLTFLLVFVVAPAALLLLGYNASLNPSIDAFFSTVASRYGHSTVTDVVLRLDESWSEHPKGHLLLQQAFYNPSVYLTAGLEPLIRGMLVLPQGFIEPRWSLSLAGNFVGHSSVNGEE